LSFNSIPADLPVSEIIPELRQSLSEKNTLVLTAPPGAGKSTVLPLALLHEPWLNGKKILMLEPRRIAARAVASRMAEILNQEVGQTIGYRIRFENRISAQTRIEVLTEGILTRMLQSDNSLDEVGLVIFDEFHERSIHADLALALCREAQQILRPDLRILVMSATLDTDELPDLLEAQVVRSEGRAYPVEIVHSHDADSRMLPEFVARQAIWCLREHKGDLLAFLPGEAEIRKCQSLLEDAGANAIIHPLFGQLPPNQQKAAILPDRAGRRKIVLASSIAETSLTIEGVNTVIDSGYTRKQVFDPASGLSRLLTVQVTVDAADQRAGRAGRTGPGICYRLWSKATHERLTPRRVPEILEADLCPLVLELAAWGITRPEDLSWVSPPPTVGFQLGRQLLAELQALENEQITPQGREMLRLACHPRIAHMLVKAETSGQKALACDLAALLEERDPLGRDSGVDMNLRIEKLRKLRKERTGMQGRWLTIAKSSESFARMLGISPDNSSVAPEETGLLLAFAYPERIASAKPGNNARFQLSNGRMAMMSHEDSLSSSPWLAIAHLDMRDGMGKIFLAAPLNPADLADQVSTAQRIEWDTRKGGLQAFNEWRLNGLVLQAKAMSDPDPVRVQEVLIQALRKEGLHLLNWDEEVKNFQNRIQCLKRWNVQESWPDVDTPSLLAHPELWFQADYLSIKKPEDFFRVPLLGLLEQWLGWDALQDLNRKAPTRISVPSGSGLPVLYSSTGDAPVVAVRIQELFGLAETPRINEGKTPVLLHLLSPGYKPVQVTADLKSFWNNAYFEVKKELKRRYPRHSWPDDPWTAPPVAKGRSVK